MIIDLVEAKIGSELSSERFFQIEMWCLHVQNRHFRLLRQSAAQCLVPVELKHNLLSLKITY